ncbi:ATP-dependent DNA helicase RecG [Alicyclobacillus cellulosilyticus]|uniref:ATP-dependent DNA helicase RecG n=1 Tax=Alicyclobacillus cellulosilyticus TaxID=1003997 RepID=A0A917KBR8_9BACL|nr:ATP-dependent DNA helicase RecG [Alicyclobacillus cellulosilyticus]GGJ08117.1 ATP-dependent DNA helicase RecG [Alicyclobacillus cellulosilyticus]
MNLREVPVTALPGVGRAKAGALAELGIRSVDDLLHHYPVRYEDWRPLPFSAFPDQGVVTAQGVVEGTAEVRWQRGKSILHCVLRIDQRFRVHAYWFNQHWLKAKLTPGRFITVRGRFDRARHAITVTRTAIDSTPSESFSPWTPVYRSSRTLPSHQLHTLILAALDQYAEHLPEVLPHGLREKYRLVTHADAVRGIHKPASAESLRQARRRLVFEEFFLFQLQLQGLRRRHAKSGGGHARPVPDDALSAFMATLPAPLTHAQVRACQEVLADLRRPSAMARLLQGDVGSGKTWVALFAAYAVWRAGSQTALMAPTEILAEQHAAEAKRRLTPLGMRVGLLTGSTPRKERLDVLRGLQSGQLHVVVGTHALLTEDVQFRDLGLVVIDEQHRFGVAQRAKLLEKGDRPDLLTISATPIPRTLALALYGDLDTSILDERPAGRQPVETRWMDLEQSEEEAIRLARRELARGHQVYVVAPLVEDAEEDAAEVISATRLAERLREQFAGFQVGLLHGRMNGREKDAVMRSFVCGELQVLVSTTVIEVGIDVPNATVMLVYHAERFGLAQLHQLRGRVGRGGQRGFCILLADRPTDIARARLDTLIREHDGFVIAERDLELRGPGELFGLRQSGLPEFALGDLARDVKVMEVARTEAQALLRDPDFWLLPAYAGLRAALAAEPAAAAD